MVSIPAILFTFQFAAPVPGWMGEISEKDFSGLREQRIEIEKIVHAFPLRTRGKDTCALSERMTNEYVANPNATNAFKAALIFGLSKGSQAEPYFNYKRQLPAFEPFFIKTSYEWCRARLLIDRTYTFGSYEAILDRFGEQGKNDFILNSLSLDALCVGKPFFNGAKAKILYDRLQAIDVNDDRLIILKAKYLMARGLFLGNKQDAKLAYQQWNRVKDIRYDCPFLNQKIVEVILPQLKATMEK